MIFFVSGTGTGVGKTWVTRGLARALARRGEHVLALKPIETGCEDGPADARALARACGHPEIADDPAFYRARAALAPYAATLEGEAPPDLPAIAARVRELAATTGMALVEGAGGLRTPIDDEHDLSDLADAIGAPLILVGRDELGVLSQMLAVHRPSVALCVLTQIASPDASARTNARILAERLACPVLRFPCAPDDDDALADAAEPLLAALNRTLRAP